MVTMKLLELRACAPRLVYLTPDSKILTAVLCCTARTPHCAGPGKHMKNKTDTGPAPESI